MAIKIGEWIVMVNKADRLGQEELYEAECNELSLRCRDASLNEVLRHMKQKIEHHAIHAQSGATK